MGPPVYSIRDRREDYKRGRRDARRHLPLVPRHHARRGGPRTAGTARWPERGNGPGATPISLTPFLHELFNKRNQRLAALYKLYRGWKVRVYGGGSRVSAVWPGSALMSSGRCWMLRSLVRTRASSWFRVVAAWLPTWALAPAPAVGLDVAEEPAGAARLHASPACRRKPPVPGDPDHGSLPAGAPSRRRVRLEGLPASSSWR